MNLLRRQLPRLLDPRLRRIAGETLWIAFGQGLGVLGALAGVKLLTERLAPAEYGTLALLLTITTLLGQIIFNPIGNGVTRFYAPAADKGELASYLSATRRLLFDACFIVAALAALSCVVALILGKSQWLLILLALLFSVFSGSNAILNGLQNAARQRGVVALHQGIDPWLRAGCAVGLIATISATGTTAIAGYTIAAALVLTSQLLFFRKLAPRTTPSATRPTEYRKKIWDFSWPFAAWGVFTLVQLGSDRWALAQFGTVAEVGLYAVLFQLGYYPISVATSLMIQLLAPILYQRAGDAQDDTRNAHVSRINQRIAALCLLGTALAFLIFEIWHAEIFELLADAQYASVSYLLPWMTLAGGLFAMGQILSLDLMSRMKTRAMMQVKIGTGILGVTANFVGAWALGIEGVVGAGIFFAVIYLIWMTVLVRQHTVAQPRETTK